MHRHHKRLKFARASALINWIEAAIRVNPNRNLDLNPRIVGVVVKARPRYFDFHPYGLDTAFL